MRNKAGPLRKPKSENEQTYIVRQNNNDFSVLIDLKHKVKS